MTHLKLAGGLLAALGLIAASACGSVPVSEARPVVAAQHAEGADWFVQTGCSRCHSVSVYGIQNPGATAPDLSVAVEDVPRRFGRSLDDFFVSPTGTMAMVLATAIPMTEGERRVAIEKLKDAYRHHQEAAGSGQPMASH